MHWLIEEIQRANADAIQRASFRRWQQVLREEIQQRLDRADALEAENADLKKQLTKLGKTKSKEAA